MIKRVHVGLFTAVLVLLFFVTCFAGCTSLSPTAQKGPAKTVDDHTLIVATDQVVKNTKLLETLQPMFESKYHTRLKLVVLSTSQAIEAGKSGEADVLVLHAPNQELNLIRTGYVLNRRSFASNYLLIVGPPDDPAGIAAMTADNAFKTLYTKGESNTPGISFVSRGQPSEIQAAEGQIWVSAGYNFATQIQNSGRDWYIAAGKNMTETLLLANGKGAYTLTDEVPYLDMKSQLTLVPLVSKGPGLLQIYSVMATNNNNQPDERIKMANDFINFMISPETQTAINTYGVDRYGKALFIPTSVSVPDAPYGYVGDHTTPATDLDPEF